MAGLAIQIRVSRGICLLNRKSFTDYNLTFGSLTLFNIISALLTSYHPLIIEAHFSVLLILLLVGDFKELVTQHYRCARIMECKSVLFQSSKRY